MATSSIWLLSVCLAACARVPQDGPLRHVAHARGQVQQAIELLTQHPQAAKAKLKAASDVLTRLGASHPAALGPAELLQKAAEQRQARRARELARLAADQMAALQFVGSRQGAPTEAQQARAREAIREVLARREFKRSQLRAVFERILQAVVRAIGRALSAVFPSLAGGSWLLQAFGIVAVALLAGLLVFLLARLLAGYLASRASSHRPPDAPTEVTDLRLERGPAAAERALAEARRLASRGQWRAALRFAFGSLLLTLDDMGLIDYRRESTNWDYVRALRHKGSPPIVGSLEMATRLFEARWYGLQPALEADFAAMLRQVQQVRQAEEGA